MVLIKVNFTTIIFNYIFIIIKLSHLVLCHETLERHFVNNFLAKIPQEILDCYSNRSIWDRSQRLPYSMDSLVALIRKVELDPQVQNWSPGRLAANLIHRFRFDGIHYDRCLDTTSGAVPIKLDLQSEYTKMQLIWQLVDGNRDDFPVDALTPGEKCSMHWMLSYAVNTTFREEELIYYNTNNLEDAGMSSWREPQPPGPGYNCDTNTPDSLAPVEMGVVWTKSGPVSSSTFLAGLAAGFKPRIVNWPTTEPAKRPIQNEWGATLAGDLAQTALLKRKSQTYIGPDGWFNTTICPREFMLKIHRDSTFSHFTVSEINGGIDGLLIGMQALELEKNSERTLSQIIDAYYNSQQGIRTKNSVPLSACSRYDNYLKFVDKNKLMEQAVTFGLEYKSMLVLPFSETEIRTALLLAREKLETEINLLRKSFPVFCRNPNPPPLSGKAEPVIESAGLADIGLILDSSSYSFDDYSYQIQVAAALALQLDIWSTTVSSGYYSQSSSEHVSGGSTLEVSDGRSGENILNYLGRNVTFNNKAELACHIVKSYYQPTGELDAARSISTTAARLADRRADNILKGINYSKSQIILLFSFARIATPDRQPLRSALWRLRDSRSDVKVIVVTRWAPPTDFQEFVDDFKQDIITLSDYNTESNAIFDAIKISQRISQVSGPIVYTVCGGPDYREYESKETIYLLPNTQRFLNLNSRFFFTSEELQIIFQTRFNSAKICWSRKDLSYDKSGESCQETGGSNGKIVFTFKNPCDGQEADWCQAIHFRLVGVDSGGINCLIDGKRPCRSADAVEITITHQGMTCGTNKFQLYSSSIYFFVGIGIVYMQHFLIQIK